jgi:hypothetical protein
MKRNIARTTMFFNIFVATLCMGTTPTYAQVVNSTMNPNQIAILH